MVFLLLFRYICSPFSLEEHDSDFLFGVDVELISELDVGLNLQYGFDELEFQFVLLPVLVPISHALKCNHLQVVDSRQPATNLAPCYPDAGPPTDSHQSFGFVPLALSDEPLRHGLHLFDLLLVHLVDVVVRLHADENLRRAK